MTMDLLATEQRMKALEAQGLGPWGTDDTVLGVDVALRHSHLRAHTTGWCTVPLCEKTPLTTTGEDVATANQAATDEARALGFYVYGDPRPCVRCGVGVRERGISGYADESGGTLCYPDKKRSPSHTPHNHF